jgi:universal bacterial protein YeaZ
MTQILCIETATDICSVALAQDGQTVAYRTVSEGLRHSQFLTLLIQDVVKQASTSLQNIDAVAISDGPGSYTGLRVGASVAKGICYALDLPLLAISTLRALANQVQEKGVPVMSTIDARRMEAYTAVFLDEQQIQEVKSTIWSEETFIEFAATYRHLILCGTGIAKAADFCIDKSSLDLRPLECDSRYLVALAMQKYTAGDFVDVAYHDPFYYKSPNITTPKRPSGLA